MEPSLALPALVGLIAIALAFDFINGLHDAANSIATVVSTRVLSPQMAVAWAAFFNFVAFLFIGLHVAETIGKGIIDPAIVDPAVIFGALAGAILWNVLTWYLGIPSSSSHALVGGLVGAGTAKGGVGAIVSSGVIKTSVFIFAAPLALVVLQPPASRPKCIAQRDVGVCVSVIRRMSVPDRYLFVGKRDVDSEVV